MELLLIPVALLFTLILFTTITVKAWKIGVVIWVTAFLLFFN